MDIIIDLRPLIGGKNTGVETYIKCLLGELFRIDRKNRYLLVTNSFHRQSWMADLFKGENIHFIQTHLPNKILNLCLSVFNFPKLDLWFTKRQKHFNGFKAKIFFAPDLRPVSTSKKVAKIITVHDLSFIRYPQFFSFKTRLWHRLLRPKREIGNASRIIAVSEFTKQELLSVYNVPENKITVIHEGVDEGMGLQPLSPSEQIKINKKYGLPADYFLFLATIEPRKNLIRMIKAFRTFKSSNQNSIKLVLAGIKNPGIFRDIKIAHDPDIILSGYIAPEDKAYVFQKARAFIYPSIYEGFGLPLLEAMKSGTPIITSSSASMPEIAADTAIYVNPFSTESIAKGMSRIVATDLHSQLQQNCLKRVKDFSWEKCALQTLALFENVKE